MLLVKIVNNEITAYPYTIQQFREENKQTSLPHDISEEFLAEHGVFRVYESPWPGNIDAGLYRIWQDAPVKKEDGRWYMKYNSGPWPEDVAIANMRNRRNGMIKDTDWRAYPDSPGTAEERQAWLDYRQALRDITNQAGFPFNIVWPAIPGTANEPIQNV